MIFLKNYYTRTTDKVDVISIHADVMYAVRDSEAIEGLVTITSPAGGAAITVIEKLPEAHDALKEALAVYPAEGKKATTRRKEEIDLGARVKAAMLGRSLSVPLKEGKLMLGHREEIILIDCETTAKRREYVIQVMGEGAGGGEEGGGISLGMMGEMGEE
jgi:secondary thiamine-phosphate synthase enzyme